VTLGKIIIAILIIIIGTRFAQIISKFVARVISKRTSIDIGIIDASQKLFFYCFSVVFAIYALYMVQVPLTAFTLMGGALALGLGFGSQNVLSNFISGIILLVERPVKTGDFIEVESSIGTVETIGLRSIRIRTQGNEHLIIPNSYLLEKPLVNWTLSDKIVRLELAVGVVYGSPVREVKRMLLAAAASVDRINNKPEPFVIFSDFGDNALLFHLVFWSRINTIVDKRTILSQLRFKVVDLFNQAGIVIAFPQRDVHLDTSSPLQVRIERNAPSTDEGRPGNYDTEN
jgi:small-conductance mechanosensitive channel